MSGQPLEKVYSPETVEEKWMARWEKDAISHADPESNRPSFSMVIPPPNVTGSLHLGHALNNTLQDILARWKRMSGFNVLWLPGLDHAGIATQNVVERQLAAEGSDRHQLGRQAFIDRVWDWKKSSGGTILKQLKRLGASCDWERERFTLDEGLSRAVTEVFTRLFEEGLIYRAERLINWCPRCRTALSDIEVEHEDLPGKMYHIRYPIAGQTDQSLTVATTRPETMLGDTAVAIHPEDARYNHLLTAKVALPLTQRSIPIVADGILVDRELGTGAVKVTPGHDFNDEKVGKRHKLPKISLIDRRAVMKADALKEAEVDENLIDRLSGQTVSAARKIVVAALENAGLLLKIEEHQHAVGKCYRCKTVVEPFDSPQWFVKVNDPENSLVQPAIDAVRTKEIRIIPESWEPNYFGWMENIEDWCISRQIWWGHQIPVWYCTHCDKDHIHQSPDTKEWTIATGATPIVSTNPAESACPRCGSIGLLQDPDVLDTWFSSALWPFSTSGWPANLQIDETGQIEAEALLARFYPTSTLVSAFDILFFWIARMIMMGLHFMKEVPFKDVYIHALVLDAEGNKMSKSKGNVIDPLEIMGRYGTDALRFTLAAMASPGRNIKLSEDRIEGHRNFCNKIWNAARFIQINRPEADAMPGSDSANITHRWIQSRLNGTVEIVITALTNYRYDEAARAAYQFIWHTFCDWYLELLKVDFQEEGRSADTYAMLVKTFEESLRLLHPFMPFLTEELWTHFGEGKHCLALAAYPKPDAKRDDPLAEEMVGELINGSVMAIRNLRGEMNIPPAETLPLLIKPKDETRREQFTAYLPYIKRLARLGEVTIDCHLARPKMAASATNAFCEIYLPLDEARVRDEIGRLEKRLGKLEKTLKAINGKLNNTQFVENAPAIIVEKNKQEATDLYKKKDKFEADIQALHKLLSN